MKVNINPNHKKNILIIVVFAVVVLGIVIGFLLSHKHIDTVKPLPPKQVEAPKPQPKPIVHNDKLIAFIIKQEGGYNPHDPSYEGVYQPTWEWYREIRNDRSYPVHVEKLIGRQDLILDFYRWYLYELRSGITVVPDWFQLMLADFWVTSMSASIRPLQSWAGVKSDGVWGTHTETAVLQKFDTIKDEIEFARWYTNERKAHYRHNGYDDSSSLIARCDIALSETIKSIHETKSPIYHRTIQENNMRVHAEHKPMSIEERLTRLEELILKITDNN